MFFTKSRKQRAEVQEYLQWVGDMLDPDGAVVETDHRSAVRHARIYPALLAPWENDAPVLAESTYGLTRDLSTRGMALIISRKFAKEEVLVGIWPTNEILTAATTKPGFLVGQIRSQVEIGAAFYKVGLELQRCLDAQHPQFDKLYQHAKCLLPSNQLPLLRMNAAHG